jgi:mannose-6-phosphate isomerase-like protein (cupin superfamily)
VAIIRHPQQPQTRGKLSKILNRKIVTAEMGASGCELWDQVVPMEGYVVPHFHDYDETLTFLSGRAQITIDGKAIIVEADTTALIAAGCVHSIRNVGSKPVRILAFHLASASSVKYPGDKPLLVEWEDG